MMVIAASTLNHYGKEAAAQHMTGHPRNDRLRYCIQHIRDVAPPASHVAICEVVELECPICCDTIQRLVHCCVAVVLGLSTVPTPTVHADHLFNFSSIRQASPLILASLCCLWQVWRS